MAESIAVIAASIVAIFTILETKKIRIETARQTELMAEEILKQAESKKSIYKPILSFNGERWRSDGLITLNLKNQGGPARNIRFLPLEKEISLQNLDAGELTSAMRRFPLVLRVGDLLKEKQFELHFDDKMGNSHVTKWLLSPASKEVKEIQ